MNSFYAFLVSVLLGLILSAGLSANAVINSKNLTDIDAQNFIQLVNNTSKHVTIMGTICSSQSSEHSKVIFLNFGKNFNTSLSAVIYDFNINSFIDAGIENPEIYFNNKKVKLDGIIRINNGKPEIVINSPKQIKIIK